MPADSIESGLRNMRERAEQLGGSCEVTSSPGAGTTVSWSVPG
jgi:signal transduction histidine kinase